MPVRRNLTFAKNAAQRRGGSVFIPAPVGGLNTVDAHGAMDQKYAVSMSNYFPMENGLMVRGGSTPYTIGQIGDVDTLMAYMDGTTEQLFACAGTSIYSIVESTVTAPVEVVGGLVSPQFQWVNISNNGGTFLWCCNGADAPYYFDGTDWTQAALTDADTNPVTWHPHNVCVYQNRLFLCVPGSLTIYYLDLDAVQGVAHPIPLGAYLERGGEVIMVGNVTVDGGYGPDDYFIAVTSEGEAVSFKGRDPSSADTWAMVGRFQFAKPMSKRSMVKYGGDLIILTEQGVAGVASMLSNELAGLSKAATEKIQPTWAALTRKYADYFGWQACIYHRRGLLLINVPTGIGFQQFVYNPKTSAWGVIEGWDTVRCLLETGGDILAGLSDVVQRLDTTAWFDTVATPNGDYSKWTFTDTNIIALVQQAFVFAGGKGSKKRYTLMRPYVASTANPQLSIGLSVDNNPRGVTTQIVLSGDMSMPNLAEWDASEWYAAEWGGSDGGVFKTRSRWANVAAIGYSVSAAVQLVPASSEVLYAGSDVQFQMSNTI